MKASGRRPIAPVAFALAIAAAAAPSLTRAADDDAELSKKLANPVSSLISVPLQNNFDCCYGPENGFRYSLNVQPVIPVSIGANTNVIVRTIVPVIYQEEPVAGQGDRTGLGDTTQSFFFTPKASKGIVFGIGPAFIWPTATSNLGSGQWAAGPTFIVLRQSGHLSVGLLANQLWRYAGDSSRPPVNTTFMQPFATYTFADTTSLSLNTETSYDWTHSQWTVPINFGVAHLVNVHGQRLQLGVFGKLYAASPNGPQAGFRFTATFLFPR